MLGSSPSPPHVGTVLITGGAGYIGSHTLVELLSHGWRAVVLDDLSNGHAAAVERAAELAGGDATLIVGDVCSAADLRRAFAAGPIDAVVHFAALKSPTESMIRPAAYYRVNVGGMATLCEAMVEQGCERLVFSSSCSVYGQPEIVPVDENAPRVPMSPYGRSKAIGEDLLADVSAAHGWSSWALRYFNPVGAHSSGSLGEDPKEVMNLVPIVLQIAAGQRDRLVIFGDDYPTRDGTCVRDYLHVMDLARAHRLALEASAERGGYRVVNLGTGRGYSVREVVAAARRVTGVEIPEQVGPRRAGDPPEVIAVATLAAESLGWRSELDLDTMISSAWRWWQHHPGGFAG